jgi:formylmethanofuran dehydrogenase subunit B
MSANKQVTCPFCSLHCTGLHLTFDGGRLAGFTPACSLGEAGFRRATEDLSVERLADFSLEKNLRTARKWLREARQPLVVLSGDLDAETVTAALRLAKHYSAVLACDEDTTGSLLALSMQAAGLLTATLLDLRQVSLVILCAVDPARTHPRLGEFLGRDLATNSLFLDPPDPLEALRWLRLAASNPTANIPAVFTGIVSSIRAASSGLLVFGPEWLRADQSFTTELLLWLKDLNQEKHWYPLYLAPAANSTGVVETILSETSYPGNLRFDQEKIDYSPRLWRAERIIQKGGTDLCLLVGQPGSFSAETLGLLSRGHSILLDPHLPAWNPPVWLRSAQVGIDVPGCFQRLDGVPVALQPVLPGRHPLMKDLLLELIHKEPPA